jgi:DNA repair protein RecO (recombination protein O)
MMMTTTKAPSRLMKATANRQRPAKSRAPMPATYTDEGIVLRRVDYGESDRILTVLTRGRGKLGVIARGVRKPKSKLAAQTDLFMRSTMQLAHGRGELEVLAQAAAVLPVLSCQEPLRLACAGACTELVDRVVESGHADEFVFDLLVVALTESVSGDRDPRTATIWFAQQMINRLGYAPHLHNCANCERVLPETPARFVARLGGLICETCVPVGDAVRCSVRTIKVLRVLAAEGSPDFWRLRLDGEVIGNLEAVVEAELAEHLGRQLRAYEMMRSLGRSNTF